MKTDFKRTVLLGTVFLTGLVATSPKFSAPLHAGTQQGFQQVAASSLAYALNTQQPGACFSTRIARPCAVVNTPLATLQAGIFGKTRAEVLKLTY